MFSPAARPAAPPPHARCDGDERRREPRYAVHIAARLHAGGRAQDTVIDDLSRGGAGLDGAIGIYANDPVEIELPDGRRLPGLVAWWLTGSCGVRFLEPLAADDPLLAGLA